MQRANLLLRPLALFIFFMLACSLEINAAELPLVRIAHGAFSEKIGIMWVGAEQGIFRKHGVHVEVINIRSGPQTMAALASGDIQVAYTIPGSVVSAATSGFDVAFFAGLVNKADGDFIASPNIRSAADLKGKRVGVSSFGATGDLAARVALQSIGIDPHRDVAIVTLGSDTLRYATRCMPRTCRWHLISR